MNNRPLDSYVVMAIAIASTAVIATTANTVQIVQDFDIRGSTLLTFIGGIFAQGSIALAMLCAMLLVRTLFRGGWHLARSDVAPVHDRLEDPPDLTANDPV